MSNITIYFIGILVEFFVILPLGIILIKDKDCRDEFIGTCILGSAVWPFHIACLLIAGICMLFIYITDSLANYFHEENDDRMY